MDVALGSLASLAFSVVKSVTSKKVAHISPLNEIENEPAFQNIKAQGYEFLWAKETYARQKIRDGWEPVTELGITGSTIFMDRNEELIMLCKKPAIRN